ncbi:killer cell lectin-like receptor subfamily G member 1 [Polypterus senegalus]|uniref:killer cell lectin-like receptor subfamily G member 1 n=1 Tax=Polypterus senegalus TaxID=55291 RepID=UPI0019649367|nr:killer cell lectin-like receptor subfamily G member 1 [Polypterus senegalus]XP_039621073.1 killer cell lectin-like receptor subfamily G member 1 [Polypterus senegalus]
MTKEVKHEEQNHSEGMKRSGNCTCSVKPLIKCLLITTGVLLGVGLAYRVLIIAGMHQTECCPELWVSNKENCYYLSTNKTTWQMSKDDCTSRGAQLAVIEDEEELVSRNWEERIVRSETLC